jgi:hypothetical protein
MTFLQLCQRLHSEAGISGKSHTTTIAQTGMLLRLVNWVLTAYEDIQNLHPDWQFLREAFSFNTVGGTQNYTLAILTLTELNNWITDDVRVYSAVSDETWLTYLPFNDFKYSYQIGPYRTSEGRPTIFTIEPDKSISLWQVPDGIYNINGNFYKRAQTMTLDANEPLIPSEYHMVIVWRALMYYGAKEGAAEVYEHGRNEYRNILRRLRFNQLPKMSWGPPLA